MSVEQLLAVMVAANGAGVFAIVGRVWSWTRSVDRRLDRIEAELRLHAPPTLV